MFVYSLMVVLFFVGLFVSGIALFIAGERSRSRVMQWVGGLVSLSLLVWFIFVSLRKDPFEWNPSYASDEAICGTYGDRETVTFSRDHTFVYRTDTKTIRGTWSRRGSDLSLVGENFSREMRLFQLRGRDRLLTDAHQDPDEWPDPPGLAKVRP
jgi:hypothetical protein